MIVSSKQSKVEFNPSIHKLKHVILHVTGFLQVMNSSSSSGNEAEDKPSVALTFHKPEPPFNEIECASVEKESLQGAIVVVDNLNIDLNGHLIVALITSERVTSPAKLVKLFLNKSKEGATWEHESVSPTHKEDTIFRNCISVAENRILLATNVYMTLLDENLKQIK